MRRKTAIALAALMCVGVATQADGKGKARGTCGAYTDRLCEAQSLEANEYLESPNGDYKFYYQGDSHALIYYVRTNPWTVVDTLHAGAWATPQELTYADPWFTWTYGSTYGTVHISAWSTDGEDDYLDGFYYDTSVTPDGDHFLVLDNNGFLKSIDDNGTLKVWAGPSSPRP